MSLAAAQSTFYRLDLNDGLEYSFFVIAYSSSGTILPFFSNPHGFSPIKRMPRFSNTRLLCTFHFACAPRTTLASIREKPNSITALQLQQRGLDPSALDLSRNQ